MNVLKHVAKQAIPFLLIGTLIAVAVAVFIFVTHILIWGVLIGAVLYVFSAIKQRFFSPKKAEEQPGHRIIDHE